MTSKEFQKWISNTKMDTSLSSKSKVNGIYDPEVAWVLISVGLGYWFFNYDSQKGPLDWMKLKVTYMRSGVIFYEVLDKRYKSVVKEEHVEMTSPFIRGWHEVCFTNPNLEYFKAENFDTLDGRVKII